MSTIDRELTITYGSISIGGGSHVFLLHDYHQVSKAYETASVEFSFVVSAQTQDEFAAYVSQVEGAFRMPYQEFVVSLHGSVLLKMAQQSTGLDAMPEILKSGDPELDTARSRHYTVRITWGMPATTGAEESVGLRNSTVVVSYGPSRRRTVTISGTYTSNGGLARDQYDSVGTSYCTAVLSALGGTYELAEEPTVEANLTDTLCSFTRVYEELIFSQGGSGLDDAAIVRQTLSLSLRREAPGDTLGIGSAGYALPYIERPVEVTANYSAFIRHDQTKALQSKWESIRSWVIQQARAMFKATFAVVSENVEILPDENRISASLSLVGVAGDILNLTLSASDELSTGEVAIPLWAGDPFDYYQYQGPAVLLRTVSVQATKKGIVAQNDAEAWAYGFANALVGTGGQGKDSPWGSHGDRWMRVRFQTSVTPKTMGLKGTADVIEVTEITASTTHQHIRLAKATSPGGGGAQPTTGGNVGQG